MEGTAGMDKTTRMRLDRFLGNMGCGSRSQVRQYIKGGEVAKDGQPVRDPALIVDPRKDQICWRGETICYRPYLYLMLHKPAGVISATEDSRERTVLDLLDPDYRNKGLFPVGRLDKDTEGLLILTNHGDLGHQLLSPKKKVLKRYYAKIDGKVDSADQTAFAAGITLDDGYLTLPAKLEILNAGTVSEVMVGIQEGKFHQIKRMFEAVGKRVLYLKRISMGGLFLDERLSPGEYRELTKEEIDAIAPG